jgi:hypothetical protein
MCKEELNNVEDIEEDQTSLESLSKDELIDVIEQLMNSKDIKVNTENVQDLELDPQEFQAGIDSISFLAGQFSTLVNIGVDKTSAIDIILNERNIEYNMQLNQMTCENNKEIAKIQQEIQENNQP